MNADIETTPNGGSPLEEAENRIASDNETAEGRQGGESGELDEPKGAGERSRLGRKLADLERETISQKEMIAAQRESLARIEQLLYEREQRYSYDRNAPSQEDDDPDKILTVAEYEKREERKRRMQADAKNRYESGYVAGIKRMYNAKDAMLYAEIEQELFTNVNEYPTHTGYQDPFRDAAINFKLAKANVLERKYSNPPVKPNVRGGTNPPTGFTSSTTTEAPQKAAPKLDEVASKFARAAGLDDDFIRESLKER
jgi:hypothetical protein